MWTFSCSEGAAAHSLAPSSRSPSALHSSLGSWRSCSWAGTLPCRTQAERGWQGFALWSLGTLMTQHATSTGTPPRPSLMGTKEEREPLPAEAPCRVQRVTGLAWLSWGHACVG